MRLGTNSTTARRPSCTFASFTLVTNAGHASRELPSVNQPPPPPSHKPIMVVWSRYDESIVAPNEAKRGRPLQGYERSLVPSWEVSYVLTPQPQKLCIWFRIRQVKRPPLYVGLSVPGGGHAVPRCPQRTSMPFRPFVSLRPILLPIALRPYGVSVETTQIVPIAPDGG